MDLNFFMNFQNILHGQLLGLENFMFLLKISKLAAFFNSFDKLFLRVDPIVLTVLKPNFLVFMLLLVTVTSDLKSEKAFSSICEIFFIIGGE